MNRLQKIETRLSKIKEELNAEGADINALSTETDNLMEERKELMEKMETRKSLLAKIGNGDMGRGEEIVQQEEKRTYAVDSKEYRNAYLKNLMGKEISVEERAALSVSNVMPTAMLNKIIEKLEQTSALYNAITVLNVPSNLEIPVENATADASFVALGTASTDSADTFSKVSFTAHKLIKTLELGLDAQYMTIDAFENFVVAQLYKKMSKAIENAILNGTGTNQPTGLLKSGEVTNTLTFTKAGMKYKDLMSIIGALPTGYNGTLVMNRTLFFKEVLGMEDTTGNKVVVADAQSPAKFNVLGFPVILDDYIADGTVLFGDLSYYYLNWVKNIEVSKDESIGFRTGNVVYRSMALLDGKKVSAEAFVVSTRAAS